LIVVNVAFLAGVPLGDPWGRDLRGIRGEAAVGGLLLRVFLLTLVALGVGELADEIVEEGHCGVVVGLMCG
jgi:hypothetical protein